MYFSKPPPRVTKKRSQSQIEARARLTGPLIYGEEAIKQLRSYQPKPNSKQIFRQDRGGGNNPNGPARPPMPINAKPTTPQRMITEFQMRTPPPTGKYHIPRLHDLGLGSNRPIERSPHESFAEFTRRVNTLTANKLELDQNLHDRFVELSLGQRPQNSAFDYGPDSRNSSRDTPTAMSVTAHGRLYPRMDTANEDRLRNVKPYETTFALHEARSSGSESDSFRPSDRYWRNTMNKQKFRGSKKEQRQAKNILIPPSAIGQRYRGMGNWQGKQNPNPESERSSGMYKSNIIEEGQVILRAASKLLNQSSRLRMREVDSEEPVKSPSRNLGYVPLKVKGLNKNPKVTFYDKIQERRESIKSNGYTPIDPIVEEIREMWKDGERGTYPAPSAKIAEKVGENRGAFGGKKLSSLVAKNVTALQGRGLSLTEADDMNPIERKLLEGLENYELSYFLQGPGHKSPRQREPIRPLSKKEKNSLGLSPGIGQTSLIDSQEDPSSPGRGRPGIAESKITKYLEELRLSGYPDKLPSKVRAEKRREAAKFMQNADDYEFDESILNNFNMSPERREDFIEGMKERRLQRIRAKAGINGGINFANPNSHISRVMGGRYGEF